MKDIDVYQMKIFINFMLFIQSAERTSCKQNRNLFILTKRSKNLFFKSTQSHQLKFESQFHSRWEWDSDSHHELLHIMFRFFYKFHPNINQLTFIIFIYHYSQIIFLKNLSFSTLFKAIIIIILVKLRIEN